MMVLNNMENKSQFRRSILQQRQELSQETWRDKSDLICQNLESCRIFQQAKTILAYFSIRQEPDISPLFNQTDKRWGFPRIENQSLIWHEWEIGQPLIKGKFDILTPLETAPILSSDQVDLILVPSVACDQRGYRLGYGGGFYDRMFSQPEWQEKKSIGIIFDFAYLDELSVEAWDYPLQNICTELQFIRIA